MTEFFLLFLLVHETDKYESQRMFDEAVDDSLAALKLLPNWFVTSKMIKKRYTNLYTDVNILYFNENSGNIAFSCNEMGNLNRDINNINADNNFGEHDPDTIIIIRLLLL